MAESQKVRARIPDSLWAAAVEMAGTYGLCRTARSLPVEYYALRSECNKGPPMPAKDVNVALWPTSWNCHVPSPPARATARWSWKTPPGRRCGSI